jgi:pyruvate dehydrogenase E2 component (dihydrolipoamide acetyltransferase)
MATDFTMPKLGLTMEEGTIVRWLAAEGDAVERGQVILEVQTDKVTVEVEAPAEGVLSARLVGEGEAVPVGTLLAQIVEPGEKAAPRRRATPLARRIAAQEGIELTAVAPAGDRITAADVRPLTGGPTRSFSSPRARKRARGAGLDWRELSGSGPRGRVIERDVLAVRPSEQQARPAVPPVPDAAASGLPPSSKAPAELAPPERVRWEEPTPVQRISAARTTAAFTSTPHFYLTSEARADALIEMRDQLLPAVERRAGVRLTITDLLVKIAATALSEHPRANAFWQAGRIGIHEHINIGIATATAAGLLVPVLHDSGQRSLAEIAAERSRLVGAARAAKLAPEDVEGGSFTLSNLGAHRVDQFQPVLNPPESVILAAGRISPRPFVVNSQLAVARTVVLTIACDHRVLDGALAAAFFDRLIQLVEEPYELLV